MGYLVASTGRLLLPVDLERQALTVAEHRMAARDGAFDPDQGPEVDTLAELASYAGVTLTRDGDWLSVATDHQGDPKWSPQAEEFYRSLSGFVRQGEVHLRGEDGSTWSYSYGPDGLEQRGSNGWDDAAPTREPARPSPPPLPDEPTAAAAQAPEAPEPTRDPGPGFIDYPGRSERPPAPPSPHPAVGTPGSPADASWGLPAGEPPPASGGRVLAMSALLLVGVLLIIGLALLVSGF